MTAVSVPVCVLYSWYLWQGFRWAWESRWCGLWVYRRRKDQTRQRRQKDPYLRLFYGEQFSKTLLQVIFFSKVQHLRVYYEEYFLFQGFGRANHAVSMEKLKTRYPDYEITWANEGYWFRVQGFTLSGLSMNDPLVGAVCKTTQLFSAWAGREIGLIGVRCQGISHLTADVIMFKHSLPLLVFIIYVWSLKNSSICDETSTFLKWPNTKEIKSKKLQIKCFKLFIIIKPQLSHTLISFVSTNTLYVLSIIKKWLFFIYFMPERDNVTYFVCVFFWPFWKTWKYL